MKRSSPPRTRHSVGEAHETPTGSPKGLALTADQAPAPPVGLVEVTIPVSYTFESATHSDTVGQDTPTNPSTGKVVTVHALSPPFGSVDVITPEGFPSPGSPSLKVATHSDDDGHDTPVIVTTPGKEKACHPLPLVVARPPGPPATHVVVLGAHAIVSYCGEEPAWLWIVLAVQVLDWSVGSVDVSTVPPLVSATHSRVEGHETASR
jgi:hypothetical protein